MGKHSATKAKPATQKAQPVDHGTAGHTEKSSRSKSAAKGAAAGAVLGPEGAAAGAVGGALEGGGDSGGSSGGYSGRTYGGRDKALVAEFAVCMAMLALSPLVDKGGDITVTKFMKKASATAAVFIILGFLSATGEVPKKVAHGLGLLVTLTVLLNERSAFGALVKAVAGGDKEGQTLAEARKTTLTGAVQSGVGAATNAISGTLDAARQRAIEVSR